MDQIHKNIFGEEGIPGLVHGTLPLCGSRSVPVFVGYNEEDGMICIGKRDNDQVPVLKIDFKGLIPHLEKHGYIIEPYVSARILRRRWPEDAITGSFSYDVTDDPTKFDPVVIIPGYEYQIMIGCSHIYKFMLHIDLLKLLPYLTEKGGYHIKKR